MSTYGKEFFEGKRPWSRIKDSILGSYMKPYLTHVKSLGSEIVLIDGFAGPGVYGQAHLKGSPLIIESQANETVPNLHRSYFINYEERHHKSLRSILESHGWKYAIPVLDAAENAIPNILAGLTDETLFVYLDPFGPSVCPFSIIEPLLNRRSSTELLIVMHAPALHRLAARHRVKAGDIDDGIRNNHNILTTTLGGEYWKDILLDDANYPTAEAREIAVITRYCERISQGVLQYTGFCPVQAERDSAAKYYVVFATRHIKGLQLMNDNMIRAFDSYMTENEFEGTLFANHSWQSWRNPAGLEQITFDMIKQKPNKRRIAYWHSIIKRHFFQFTESEFIAAVKRLSNAQRIAFHSPTKRLNNDAILRPT